MTLEEYLMTILSMALALLISSLPLYFSVKILDGNISIFKTILVMILTTIGSVVFSTFLPIWGTVITWIFLILVFKLFFDLTWFRAILAWALWIMFIFLINFILGTLGFSFITLKTAIA